MFLLVVFSSMTIACSQPSDQQDEDMPAGAATMQPMPAPSPTETPSITAPTVPAVMITPSPTTTPATVPTPPPSRTSAVTPTATSTPTTQPTPTVPPRPILAIMHDGKLHRGWPQEFSWPTESGSERLILGPMHIDAFSKTSTITVGRGDDAEVVVSNEGADLFELSVNVIQAQVSGQVVGWGHGVYSSSAESVVSLDLPPGFYFLFARYEWEEWFVLYGFKVESIG